MSPEQAGYWLWGVWYVTWWMAAIWSAKATSRPARGTNNLDRLLALVGVILLFPLPARRGESILLAPLWRAPAADWGLVGAIAAAFAFCWWARVHLGRLWSGLVTTKADHRIVDTGPYGLVRHPIYTGVMAAALCLALIKASPLALAGAALLVAGFRMTARKEERFLRAELGPAAYDAYAARVPMLVPGSPA